MYNELFHIGPFTVYGYGLMIGIGIVVAYFTAERRAKRRGLDPEMIFGLVFSCVISGFLGSKILYTITVLDEVIKNPANIWKDLSQGWVVYGGILGGIAGASIYCKIKKLNILKYLDNAFPSVAYGQGFGRIGCFLAGCCYGKECDGPLCVTFTHSNFAPNNVSLFPSQLVSSALDFLNAFVLILMYRKFNKPGQGTFAYLVFYSVGRFIIEFYRGDLRGNVGSLTTSQFIAVFTFVGGVIGFILCTLHKEKAVETEEADINI